MARQTKRSKSGVAFSTENNMKIDNMNDFAKALPPPFIADKCNFY